MTTIYLTSIGCKLNQIEIESIASNFVKSGFNVNLSRITAKTNKDENINPLFTILNTCTVTSKAEQKVRRQIRLILKIFPNSPLLITGCYAEVEENALKKIDKRALVIPGRFKDSLITLPNFLQHRNTTNSNEKIEKSLDAFIEFVKNQESKEKKSIKLTTDTFISHSRASIKIQDGCNNNCSYCRIKIARGKSISLPSNKVIKTIQEIEKSGWNEVVLTGVNLSNYKDGNICFVNLLKLILEKTKNIAIRISSLYPDIVDENLATVLKNKRIRPHFHLSIQSGSDKILSHMRRPYTARTVIRAVKLLRSAKNNPFIACDIIAGYPKESEEDFLETLNLCRNLNFSHIHAFPFSPRPDTEAWDLLPRIQDKIVSNRIKKLIELSNKNKLEYESFWIGKPLEAIVEKQIDSNTLKVVTENYISCIVKIPNIEKFSNREYLRGSKVIINLYCIGRGNLIETT